MQRVIVFNAQDILELLKHYTAFGTEPIPMDATLEEFLISTRLNRMIGLMTKGSWDVPESITGSGWLDPLHIRYEGKRVLTWGVRGRENPVYQPEEETKYE